MSNVNTSRRCGFTCLLRNIALLPSCSARQPRLPTISKSWSSQTIRTRMWRRSMSRDAARMACRAGPWKLGAAMPNGGARMFQPRLPSFGRRSLGSGGRVSGKTPEMAVEMSFHLFFSVSARKPRFHLSPSNPDTAPIAKDSRVQEWIEHAHSAAKFHRCAARSRKDVQFSCIPACSRLRRTSGLRAVSA